MPIKRCMKNGKKGYKWGNQKCYTGPNAKKKAKQQAKAIKASRGSRK